MSTVNVSVYSSAQTVVFVATKMLNHLQWIVRESGLSPAKLTREWDVLEDGISTWLGSRHLKEVYLEIYNPVTDALVKRWDLTVVYDWTGDGTLRTDTEALRYHILKAGVVPSKCDYRIVVDNHPGAEKLLGWGMTSLLSTAGFSRHSIGTTIGASGLGSNTSYLAK